MNLLNRLIKLYPILCNINIIICTILRIIGLGLHISNYTYVILGNSILVNVILFMISLKLKLPFWHRVLIFNMTICLIPDLLNSYGYDISDDAYKVIITAILTSLITLITFWKNGGKYFKINK